MLHLAQRLGWVYICFGLTCSFKGSTPLWFDCSEERSATSCTQAPLRSDVLSFSYATTVTLGCRNVLKDCSVKCHGWTLNSRYQHQFTNPIMKTVVRGQKRLARGRKKNIGEKEKWTKQETVKERTLTSEWAVQQTWLFENSHSAPTCTENLT